MKFSKYHGLGNVYIVIAPQGVAERPNIEAIRTICHPHFGVGSDGILWGPLPSQTADFGVKIYNPDGSEAEKSGNGLRIFARYLLDSGLVGQEPFSVETLGGVVMCEVEENGRSIQVNLGQVKLQKSQQIQVSDRTFHTVAANVGNPHCVILLDEPPTPELAQTYGPLIENLPLFPKRTNVQFMFVLDRKNIQIEIWERGAGYTLASGSSSVAATAVAVQQGLCNKSVTVQMPGGTLSISLDEQFYATISGSVTKICEGGIAPEMFNL
ncbi:Diaminopimelate epimerase [hydrothermal vent metagenome]|uniref:Diaminopimelate epimerase n=1 Tax=hydrothermal vent metagenome TaxID=652676 RepID=A0A3B0V6G8_9ZZZZ